MNPGPTLLAAFVGISVAFFASCRFPRIWVPLVLASAAAAFAASISVLATGGAREWRSTFSLGGEMLHLRFDAISALFLALVCLVGGVLGWWCGCCLFPGILERWRASGLGPCGAKVEERASAQHGIAAAVLERTAFSHRLGGICCVRLFSNHTRFSPTRRAGG